MRKSLVLIMSIAWVVTCAAVSSAVAAAEEATYVGSQKCMKCHFKQHATWKKEKHAAAYDTIAKEADKELCYPCHTTGFGKPSGFKNIEATPDLANVGCEDCHGAASKHVELAEAAKAKGGDIPPEVKAAINRKTTACTNCHNPHVTDTAAEARKAK